MKIYALVRKGVVSKKVLGLFDSEVKARECFNSYYENFNISVHESGFVNLQHNFDGYHDFSIQVYELNAFDGKSAEKYEDTCVEEIDLPYRRITGENYV